MSAASFWNYLAKVLVQHALVGWLLWFGIGWGSWALSASVLCLWAANYVLMNARLTRYYRQQRYLTYRAHIRLLATQLADYEEKLEFAPPPGMYRIYAEAAEDLRENLLWWAKRYRVEIEKDGLFSDLSLEEAT